MNLDWLNPYKAITMALRETKAHSGTKGGAHNESIGSGFGKAGDPIGMTLWPKLSTYVNTRIPKAANKYMAGVMDKDPFINADKKYGLGHYLGGGKKGVTGWVSDKPADSTAAVIGSLFGAAAMGLGGAATAGAGAGAAPAAGAGTAAAVAPEAAAAGTAGTTAGTVGTAAAPGLETVTVTAPAFGSSTVSPAALGGTAGGMGGGAIQAGNVYQQGQTQQTQQTQQQQIQDRIQQMRQQQGGQQKDQKTYEEQRQAILDELRRGRMYG